MGAVKASAKFGGNVTPNNLSPVQADSSPFDALWIGTGGNIAIKLSGNGADVTLLNVQDGTFLPISGTHVLLTGTTADQIVWLEW